jgi:hypothetical protein
LIGFVYEADQEAVRKAQEEYDAAKREYDLEDKIARLEEYQEQWREIIEGYQDAVDKAEAGSILSLLLGADWEQDIKDLDTSAIDRLAQYYKNTSDDLDENIQGSVAHQIKNLEELADSWDEALHDIRKAVEGYTGDLALLKAFEDGNYADRLLLLDSFKSSAIIMLSELAAAARAAAEELAKVGDAPPYDPNVDYAALLLDAETYEDAAAYAALRDAKIAGEGIDAAVVGATEHYLEEWMKAHSYANGGIVDYTGAAMLHGSPSASEVVFNAGAASKLYEYVTKTPSLVQDFVKQALNTKKEAYGEDKQIYNPVESVHVSIGDIYLSGVQDTDALSEAIVSQLPIRVVQKLFGLQRG